MNYLRRSIFLLLVALQDTYPVTNIDQQIRNCGSLKMRGDKYNVEYRDGIKSEGDKIGMPCTHTTVM